MYIRRLDAVLVAQDTTRPKPSGVEPTGNANLLAFELLRPGQRRTLGHKNIGLAKFAIRENRDRHIRRAAALERQIHRQGELAGVELAGHELVVAQAVVFVSDGAQVEALEPDPAIA